MAVYVPVYPVEVVDLCLYAAGHSIEVACVYEPVTELIAEAAADGYVSLSRMMRSVSLALP